MSSMVSWVKVSVRPVLLVEEKARGPGRTKQAPGPSPAAPAAPSRLLALRPRPRPHQAGSWPFARGPGRTKQAPGLSSVFGHGLRQSAFPFSGREGQGGRGGRGAAGEGPGGQGGPRAKGQGGWEARGPGGQGPGGRPAAGQGGVGGGGGGQGPTPSDELQSRVGDPERDRGPVWRPARRCSGAGPREGLRLEPGGVIHLLQRP
ncbi:unnamed protein product [Boreogadus saida]